MSQMVASLTLKADAKGVVAASREAKAALNDVKGAANDVGSASKGVVAANTNMAASTRSLTREQSILRDAFAASRTETKRASADGVQAMGALARAATGAGVAHNSAAKAAMGASAANTNLAGTSRNASLAMSLAAGAAGGLIGAMNPLELAVIAVGIAYKAYKDEMDVAARSSAAQAQMVATLSPILAKYKEETDKAAAATGRLASQHRNAAEAAREQLEAELNTARLGLARARAAVVSARREAADSLAAAQTSFDPMGGSTFQAGADQFRLDANVRAREVELAKLTALEDEFLKAGRARREQRRGGNRNGIVMNNQRGSISDWVDPNAARPDRGSSARSPAYSGERTAPAARGAIHSALGTNAGAPRATTPRAPQGPSREELARLAAIEQAEDKRNQAIAQRGELIDAMAGKSAEDNAAAYLSEASAARLLKIKELMAPLLVEGLGFSEAYLQAEIDRTAAIVDAAEAEAARVAAVKATAESSAKALTDEKTLSDAREAATGRLTAMRTEEANQAGKTREELEVMALVEGEINRLKELGVPLTEAQIEAERKRFKVLAEGIVAARQANELADRATQRMERAADDVRDAWDSAWERMLDGSLDGFEDFGKALVKMWKAQILRQIMQRIQVPVSVQTSEISVGNVFGEAKAGGGGMGAWFQKIFGAGQSGGQQGGFLNGLKAIFTNGANAFKTSAQGVGGDFEKIAVSFGAKAGGKLAGLANGFGQAFAGYQAGSTVANMVGLRGSNNTTAQGIGDAVFAGVGMALGGPIGSAIGTFISRAIGTMARDKDYAYARSDVVVSNGQFRVVGTDVHDGGDGAAVGEAAGGLAIALNEAAKLFKLDLSRENGAYSSFGYTTGRFGIGAGFFGGAVNTAGGGVYDQTSDAMGTGRKGRSNLEAVGTQYGQVVMNQADAAAAATEIVKDTIIRMAQRAGSAYTAAEIAVIRSAQSIEEAAARITRGREFSQSLTDMIEEITDPAMAARRKAIKAVEDQITALRDEANGLIGAGLATADVLLKIDQLRDLKLAETLRELGNAAGVAADAFQAAAPRLQDWLDKVRISEAAQLSPTDARAQAYASYERVLEKAKAGDAEALGSITGYADALIAADRAATGDAQARLRLFQSVTGAVEGLVGIGTKSTPALLEDLIKCTRDGLDGVTDAVKGVRGAIDTSATTGGLGGGGDTLTVTDFDAGIDRLGEIYGDATRTLGSRFDDIDLSGFEWPTIDIPTWEWPALPEVRFPDFETLRVNIGAEVNSNLSREIRDGLARSADFQVNELGGLLRQSIGRLDDLSGAFEDLGREQGLTNSYLRMSEGRDL